MDEAVEYGLRLTGKPSQRGLGPGGLPLFRRHGSSPVLFLPSLPGMPSKTSLPRLQCAFFARRTGVKFITFRPVQVHITRGVAGWLTFLLGLGLSQAWAGVLAALNCGGFGGAVSQYYGARRPQGRRATQAGERCHPHVEAGDASPVCEFRAKGSNQRFQPMVRLPRSGSAGETPLGKRITWGC